jgi:hypothetical protein
MLIIFPFHVMAVGGILEEKKMDGLPDWRRR